jgi:Na+/serine symporter
MKVWFSLFVMLFVVAQLGMWLKNFIAPLPWYILGGIFLAIASNYEKNMINFINTQVNKIFNKNESPTNSAS